MTKYTWIGPAGDDDWANPANWRDDATGQSGAGFPGAGDTASLDDAASVNAGAGASVAYANFVGDVPNSAFVSVLTGTLDTADSLSVFGDLGVGAFFTLQVDAGGDLEATNPSDGSAAVSIDDDGTLDIVGGVLHALRGGVQVGDTDDGALTIESGGSAILANSQFAALTLGDDGLGVGTVTVTGGGSRLTVNGGGVDDGYYGQGSLIVDDSALATIDDDLFLGANQGAIGQVTVESGGAELNVKGEGTVGDSGFGAVNVNGGGTADFGALDIAVNDTSGDPSTLSPSYVSVVGGAVVAATRLSIAPVNTVLASLSVTGAITVGDGGYGELDVGQFGVASGASLDVAAQNTSGAYAGAYPTGASSDRVGDPSFVSVEDDGSLTITGAIVVGDAGYGELSVSNFGTVAGGSLDVAKLSSSGAFAGSAAAGPVGDAPVGNPSFVTIDQATVTISGAATVGDGGYGALYLEFSASLSADSLIVANQKTSGQYGADHTPGSVVTGSFSLIDLDDSTLTIAGQAVIGEAGYGGALVAKGSLFSVGSLDIAAQASSGDVAVHDGSFVDVTGDDGMGDDSTLTVVGDAVVGDAGYGALTDFAGAKTTIGGDLTLGLQSTSGSAAGSAPDLVDVDGTGSRIAVTGVTKIGVLGAAEVDATNHGRFSTGSITMANGVLHVDTLSLVAVGAGSPTVSDGVDVETTGSIAGTGEIVGFIENDGEISVGSGTLYLDGEIGGSGDIRFADAGGAATLKLDAALAPGNGDTLANTLKNFGDNDALDLSGMAFVDGATATVEGSKLTVASGGVTDFFTLSGAVAAHYYAYDDQSGGTVVTDSATPPCYVRGTRILTARGAVAVEALAVGDRVVTASGASRPIRWLGHRSVEPSRHRDPAAVRPVRVSAHAFGEGRPQRDLWLSPDHCLAWEGAFVPVSRLVNARSVAQIAVERVEYWHVELDAHDVMLAEGLTAESYLDTGNRAAFANGGAFVEAHPDFAPRHWADTCLPLALDGAPVAAAKARLIARLAEQGVGIDHEADAHVLIDGARVDPIRLDGARLAFALPAGGRDIALRSRVFVPAHALAHSDDPRALGLCVGALEIDGARVALAGGDAAGWHEAELDGARFTHRWTNGATPLPPGTRLIIVELVGVGHFWTERQENADALTA